MEIGLAEILNMKSAKHTKWKNHLSVVVEGFIFALT